MDSGQWGVFLSCEWRVTWRDPQRWLDGGIMRRRRGSGAAACWKQPDVQCVVGALKNGAGTRQRPPHRPAMGIICFFYGLLFRFSFSRRLNL